jgi:hypothetical protein
MSKNITTSIICLKIRAEQLEEEIDNIDTDATAGCDNCGFLTQSNIDNDQELRNLISELTEVTEALDYLEKLL